MQALLKQRLITAASMASLIAVAIFYLPTLILAVLLAVLVGFAAWEWAGLANVVHPITKLLYVASCVGWLLLTVHYTAIFAVSPALEAVQSVMGWAGLWWSIALLWVAGFPASKMMWRSVVVRCLMGWWVLVPAWLALVFLHQQASGALWVAGLIALVACADSSAYFCGRAWGRAKLAPAVSPGKSWAGFWGALVISTLTVALIWYAYKPYAIGLGAAISLTIVTILAAVLGDLLESMVKRYRGVKDSGALLPGHGGLLDRIDSLSAAAPVFTLGFILAGI